MANVALPSLRQPNTYALRPVQLIIYPVDATTRSQNRCCWCDSFDHYSRNRKYRSHGQRFQNQYKPILCQEGLYMMELVRYIPLNPLQAGLVEDMEDLEKHPWCGHSAILGNKHRGWQRIRLSFTCGHSAAYGHWRGFGSRQNPLDGWYATSLVLLDKSRVGYDNR